MSRSVLAGLLCTAAPSAALRAWRADLSSDALALKHYSFREFVKDFDRAYEPGSQEWALRESAFNASLGEIVDFQSEPGRSWSKGITRFMDYTRAEYRALLGYKGRGGSRRGAPSESVTLFRSDPATRVPARMMLRKDKDSLLSLVRDQGMCGSCWAEAATSVLEGHLEANKEALAAMVQSLNGTQPYATLSSQTMVSCTANPRHCGGTGGCEGATVELGYELVKERGMPLAVAWPYASGMGGTPTCKSDVFSTVRLGITGYTVLPANKFSPLKEAIFQAGAPVAVSVDATGWSFYSGGVYTDGNGEFTVNHAVTLMGYQEPQGKSQGFWLIKNSWGTYWGESGYIRLEMKGDEESHCGWDHKTHDGLACDGDPDTAWVCGTCGVLYDSVIPTGVHVTEGSLPSLPRQG